MKRHLRNGFWGVIYSSLLSLVALSAVAQAPVITSFNPGNGPVSTTVTIVGQNFNTTSANNVVFFGATQATVQSVLGSTTLTVTVPYGADYRYVSVTDLTTGLIGYSAIPFVQSHTPMSDGADRPPVYFTSGTSTFSRDIKIADVNWDGKPDLIVANADNTVSVFPNTITSTIALASFGVPVTLGTSSGSISAALTIGDADGDGWLDIAAVYSGSSSVFLYRNTTGTPGNTPSFASAAAFGTNATPVAVGMGDLDLDGKLDLVVGCSIASNNVYVLRNTSTVGTINFAFYQTFSAGTNPSAVVIGDMDQDGLPDVAVSNMGSNDVSVFRNVSSMGSISLATPSTLAAGTSPSALIIGDFDGDTKLELATANTGSDNVSVFLNTSISGSITFAPKADFSTGVGSGPVAIAIGDILGGGIPDMLVIAPGNSTGGLLLNTSTIGNLSFGGGFGPAPAASNLAISDLNADGRPDAVAAVEGTTSNNVAVFLQRIPQVLTITSSDTMFVDALLTATITTTATSGGGTLNYNILNGSGSAFVDSSGLISAISAGEVTLTISTNGDTDYASATVSQLITINKTTPTLTFNSANTLSVEAALTAAVSTSATYGRGGSITFLVTAGSGSATVDSVTGYLTAVSSGTVTLVATSAGDSDYFPATGNQLIIITQVTPTLTITSSNSMVVDQALTATFTTTATASDGGAITFAISAGSGSATVNPSTGQIVAVGAGTVTLLASAAGDTNYYSTNISLEITIGMSTPTFTITSANTLPVDNSITVTINTTASHDIGTLSYSIFNGSGSAFVDMNGILTAISAGDLTLTVTSAGNTDYNQTSVDQYITVTKGTPILSITSDNTVLLGASLQAVTNTTATYDRGGAVTFSITSGSGSATVDVNTGLITTLKAGTNTLTAMSAGDADYNPAVATQQITILQVTPTLTFTSTNTLVVDGTLTATVTTTATASSGGAVTFAVVAGSGSATVNSSTGLLTAISVGTVTLTATAAGDTNYGSTSVSQLITINKATPTLNITLASTLNVDQSLTVTTTTSATLGRGGNITYSIVAGTGSATINANTGLLTAISVGTVTVTASNAGDTNYYATSTSQQITIGKVTPTLTITSASSLNINQSLTVTTITSATLGRGGNITYRITAGTGSATINSSTGLLTAIRIGTVTVTASNAGDTNYYATSTSQQITILKATPTLTFTSTNTLVVDGTLTATVTTTATSSSGGAVTFAVVAGSGSVTVNSSTGLLTAISVGTITLTATAAGDTNYNSTSVSQLITVNKVTPTLTITSANSLPVGDSLTATVTTTATGGRGGVITFAVVAGSGSATVNANTGLFTAISGGAVTLTATSAGDTNYYSASKSQLITISSNTPTTISSFSPLSGPISTTVTINGTNFGSTPSDNVVFFGATQGTVLTASHTVLTVNVPYGANYQYISVTRLSSNSTAYSNIPFVLTTPNGTNLVDFAPVISLSNGVNDNRPLRVSIKDFDGDGKPDLAVIYANPNNRTVLFLNQSTPGGTLVFSPSANVLLGNNFDAVASADFNGDGKPDLAIVDYNAQTVSVYKNVSTLGNLSFTLQAAMTPSVHPTMLEAGDMNSDGLPDIILGYYDTQNFVTLFRNRSNFNFDNAVSFTVGGTSPEGTAIGDINGDGMPDIVSSNLSNSTISILVNAATVGGALSFNSAVTYTLPNSSSAPHRVAIGDINGDGKLDVVTANYGSSDISIFRNDGAQGVGAAISLTALSLHPSVGTNPYAIAIGDVTGDGIPDLVVGNYSSNTISVLKNTTASTSTITLASRIDYSSGASPFWIELGDLNSDSKLDIAVGHEGNNVFTLLQNVMPVLAPVITSFAPASGSISTSVTITGSNFNATANQNVVFFGATQATVTGATSTSLTVTVPYGANYQYISVTNLAYNETGYSASPFVVTYSTGFTSFFKDTGIANATTKGLAE